MRRFNEQAIGTLSVKDAPPWLESIGGAGADSWPWWPARRTLVQVPIRQLARAAHDIEVGNYNGERMVSERQDEVGELVRAFGTMSDSIARRDRDVRRMAYTDSLTGLTNRLAFRESLDHRLMMLRGAGRQLALLFADIDDFKRVNDTLGHEAGDEVLQQFAHRIRDVVDQMGGDDALLARFGGDEFVMIQDGDVRGSATRLAEKLVAELGRPIVVQDRKVFLGTSIGITLFPEDASGATALMKNGDIAMYQAKVAGSCYRFYSRAMDQAVERRVRMEQELRGAWERGELSLMYQPVFRMADSRIVGAEALLRWQHPELGMVAPSVFIDVAEQSGLIEIIGPRVLRAACAAAARWGGNREAMDPLFVSVNVSPRQLRSGDLPDVVAECLRDTGLPASRLHLELPDRRHQRRGACQRTAGHAAPHGREGVAGRFRHRFLRAQPPAPRTGGRREDRPQFHRRHGARPRQPGPDHRDHRHGALAGHHRGRRGRGEGRPVQPAARTRLRPGAGLLAGISGHRSGVRAAGGVRSGAVAGATSVATTRYPCRDGIKALKTCGRDLHGSYEPCLLQNHRASSAVVASTRLPGQETERRHGDTACRIHATSSRAPSRSSSAKANSNSRKPKT